MCYQLICHNKPLKIGFNKGLEIAYVGFKAMPLLYSRSW